MEAAYMIAMLISIFCHAIGLFYNPVESSAESTVFLIVAIMFLHKLKLKHGASCPNVSQMGQAGLILEVAALCLALQVLLVAMWFPAFRILKLFVDAICNTLQDFLSDERAWLVEKINNSAVTVALLSAESVVLLRGLEIDDVQKVFGSKEDCLSPSELSLVNKEELKVLRREAKLIR
ncbi:uncharacterized protein LOC108092418 [Drosophila ficusphila]|uniref:uncharacterized protein LOC108092418 n=1 Tax=Drosophila ficusphila TaxID=30025 RepID=UPI0007E5F52E|nr:uncharacterized protein LOC108092418 [Drosophila ficusphila]